MVVGYGGHRDCVCTPRPGGSLGLTLACGHAHACDADRVAAQPAGVARRVWNRSRAGRNAAGGRDPAGDRIAPGFECAAVIDDQADADVSCGLVKLQDCRRPGLDRRAVGTNIKLASAPYIDIACELLVARTVDV